MLTLLLAILISAPAGAQTFTTVNENLATSTSTLLVDTNSNRLDVGTATYTGSIPGIVLFVGSNTVIGTGTGAASEVVIYATGTVAAITLAGNGLNITGVPVFLSSQAWTSAFYSTFSLVAASGGAHVDCVADYILTVSSSSAVLRFSDDTTTGDYQFHMTISSGVTSVGVIFVNNANANNINLVPTTAFAAKNHHIRAHFSYSVLLDKVKEVAVKTDAIATDVAGNEVEMVGGGHWIGGNTPTDGIINTSGSLSSGVVTCYYTQL